MLKRRLLLCSAVLWFVACQPPPAQVPPPWCEADGTLEVDCSGPNCVAGVIIDYRRLEPRGYRTFSLSGDAVTKKTVEALCTEHVTQVLGAEEPDQTDSDLAGDFYNCFLRYSNNDNWLVTVHGPTGQVVFAGLEIWANPIRDKDPPVPEGWLDPAPLGCTDGDVDPAASPSLRTTGIPVGTPPASTALEAWQTAKRLNLVEQFVAGRPFRAMVVSYSEATGEFDPGAADWYVWIAVH